LSRLNSLFIIAIPIPPQPIAPMPILFIIVNNPLLITGRSLIFFALIQKWLKSRTLSLFLTLFRTSKGEITCGMQLKLRRIFPS
jgi:hypothetical protein